MTFNFFNPKAGIFYTINDKQDAYLSFGVGNREPNSDNYFVSEPGNIPDHETMNDWELGYDLKS